MEIVWPKMPWDVANDISYNNIHDVMQMLGDGGSIYTLGPQGNVYVCRANRTQHITIYIIIRCVWNESAIVNHALLIFTYISDARMADCIHTHP